MNRGWSTGPGGWRDERGAAALEFVIVVPALLLIIGLMVAGGRLQHARATVTGAAESAARAASLARSAPVARSDAQAVVASETAALGCVGGPTVTVDTRGFAAPLGRQASVRVEVRCAVPLLDLAVGLPTTVSIHTESESVLDRYRGRS